MGYFRGGMKMRTRKRKAGIPGPFGRNTNVPGPFGTKTKPIVLLRRRRGSIPKRLRA